MSRFPPQDALGATYPGTLYPNTTKKTHAHHIVMQNGPYSSRAQEAVRKSQAILLQYGINPLTDRENLVWAPNHYGHTTAYALDVLKFLQEADESGVKANVLKALQQVARKYIKGDYL